MKDHDGTPPETLEQLVPKYIVRLPEDPFAIPDEKIPDGLKHHQRWLDGRGYLYLQKPGGDPIRSPKDGRVLDRLRDARPSLKVRTQ